MNTKSPFIHGVLCLLLVAGCGAKTTTPPPLTQSAFIDQYCASVARCCGVESLPSDPQTCIKVLAGSRGSFDQASSGNCLSQISANQKDPQWCTAYVNPPIACNEALGALLGERGVGSGKPGDACSAASDCAAPNGNAYAACVPTGSVSEPLGNECTEAIVVDGGATASCSGDLVFDAVGWIISDDVEGGYAKPVCADELTPTCTFTTDGACVTRLAQGFVAPGQRCDLEHACAYGACSADSAGTCSLHYAPDDGLKLLCAPPSP